MVLVLLVKQCFTGWMYWGRYGPEERQTTGWLGTCRNTFPCQTTNIMEGEPLGGRWWVLRIEKGGGKAGQYLDCVFRWRSCLQVLHRLYSVSNHVSSLLWVDAAGGVPPVGGMVVGGQGGVVSLPTLLSIIPLIAEVMALIYGYYFR